MLQVLSNYLPGLLAPSPVLGGVVSTAFGLVILVNVVASSFMLLYLSFIPGGARKKYMEAAKKKGDKDAEARYSFPKLYAEGFSQEAKEFNCCQRAHQQALETYANFVVCSLVGGIRQPFLTSFAGVLYIIARVKWAQASNFSPPSHLVMLLYHLRFAKRHASREEAYNALTKRRALLSRRGCHNLAKRHAKKHASQYW